MRVALIIPTRNAGPYIDRQLSALATQTRQPDQIFVVDSSSTDETVARYREFGAQVEVIAAETFNHGGTRRWASAQVDADVLIYLTQDAIPATPETFAALLDGLFSEPDIGAAYGRQLPHEDANLLSAQSRHFNYPEQSLTKRKADSEILGIKTCFSSNSFCAYRKNALNEAGGFPENVIGSEDAYVAARMLLKGYAIHYAARAEVHHSHNYSVLQEFRRYFDIGVFYGRERWIRNTFGSAKNEGFRYLCQEVKALQKAKALYLLPEVLARTGLKVIGYRLGQIEQHLPHVLKRYISMFPGYWK